MEQIIHTLSVLELIMLLPILLAGYRERKKYKNAEKLYELPALKIGQEIYQLKAGEARKASIKDIEITRERNITYHAETIKREAIYFSEEDIGKTIFKETGENCQIGFVGWKLMCRIGIIGKLCAEVEEGL